MPLKSTDPFTPNHRMRASVNPFVGQFSEGVAAAGTPIIGGEALREIKGRWRRKLADQFGVAQQPTLATWAPERTPLIVEIGCHKGTILVSMASDHPSTQFVGFDITYKRVVTTAQRLTRSKCTNAAAVLANGRGLNQLFAPGEVDGLVIFFPDPWPKARHAKNRLLNDDFGPVLANILASGGWIWFKTDSFSYFVDAEKSLTDAGFRAVTGKKPSLCEMTYMSTFESHFTALHQPIADQVFIKSSM